MAKSIIGIIGGSGLYQMDGLKNIRAVALKTPVGKPSDRYIKGNLGGTEVVFLPRHGKGHRWLPTEVNFRANLFGMKKLGVERIISVSAVGSLQQEIAPGDLVVPDQFIDRTSKRPSTFFGQGIVAHVSFADPFCKELSTHLVNAAREEGARVHAGGTYLCMEGPQFSTRAESKLYRVWGADVIGMTNLQEAKLAREAEICFGTLALATDYDCWHESHEDVSVDAILAIIRQNVATAKTIIKNAVGKIKAERNCSCSSAMQYAIITDKEAITEQRRANLDIIIGKYL